MTGSRRPDDFLPLLSVRDTAGSWQEPEGSISLQQPGTAYHSVGDEVGVDGPAAAAEQEEEEEVDDVFSSPVLSNLRASSSPEQRSQQQQQHAGSSFQFATATADSGSGAAAPADDDGSSSGGETEVTVSEAAVVARTLTRASVLQKDREHLREQVRDLSQELHDLKGRQKQMAQHLQAAHADGGIAGGGSRAGGRPQQPTRQRPQQAPAAQRAAAAADGGDAGLEERCRLQAVEERHLRSEVEMLNRKVCGSRLVGICAQGFFAWALGCVAAC